jgi:hypothetical protein
MILNIIFLLKNSLIGRGNLSKRGGEGKVYEALLLKFDGVYKIFLLHTSRDMRQLGLQWTAIAEIRSDRTWARVEHEIPYLTWILYSTASIVHSLTRDR